MKLQNINDGHIHRRQFSPLSQEKLKEAKQRPLRLQSQISEFSDGRSSSPPQWILVSAFSGYQPRRRTAQNYCMRGLPP